MQNCELPDAIIGFVESENIDVALRALESGTLLPISEMGHPRDQSRPGEHYVYFRIMISGETPGNMAFGSVGSGITAYKARMAFRTGIWTRGQGGYVGSFDGMGHINGTPENSQMQRQTFLDILSPKNKARSIAEVGILGSVSMNDLQSIWCLFPYPLSELQKKPAEQSQLPRLSNQAVRQRAPQAGAVRQRAYRYHRPRFAQLTSTIAFKSEREEAQEYYRKLTRYLPNTSRGGSVRQGARTYYWIIFTR